MPTIIDRKQAAAGTTAARASAKPQSRNNNRVLIFSCVAAIVLCWAFIAMQIFGSGFTRSSRPAAPASVPAGIKIMPLSEK